MRVTCWGAEWLVTRVESSSRTSGKGVHHFAIHCTGVDDLVRGHEAIFLTQLDQIDPVDPRNTELIADTSPQYKLPTVYIRGFYQAPRPALPPRANGFKILKPMTPKAPSCRGSKNFTASWRPSL